MTTFSSDGIEFVPEGVEGEISPPSPTAPEPWEPIELEVGRGVGVGVGSPSRPLDDTERRVAEAREEGRLEGLESGRRMEAEKLETAFRALEGLVEEIERVEARRADEVPEEVAALAVAVAGHLVEREIRSAPDVISDLVRRAIAEFLPSESLKVRLNPSDLAMLSSGLDLTNGQVVRWLPDPAVRPGGCLVESPDRIVDARIGTTLDRIYRVLTDA